MLMKSIIIQISLNNNYWIPSVNMRLHDPNTSPSEIGHKFIRPLYNLLFTKLLLCTPTQLMHTYMNSYTPFSLVAKGFNIY